MQATKDGSDAPSRSDTASWGGAAVAGIRPSPGSLAVLTFAFSEGMFRAGAASAFVMALGTAATVTAMAAFAARPHGPGRRQVSGSRAFVGPLCLALEFTAGAVTTLLGAALFIGSLQR